MVHLVARVLLLAALDLNFVGTCHWTQVSGHGPATCLVLHERSGN